MGQSPPQNPFHSPLIGHKLRKLVSEKFNISKFRKIQPRDILTSVRLDFTMLVISFYAYKMLFYQINVSNDIELLTIIFNNRI